MAVKKRLHRRKTKNSNAPSPMKIAVEEALSDLRDGRSVTLKDYLKGKRSR